MTLVVVSGWIFVSRGLVWDKLDDVPRTAQIQEQEQGERLVTEGRIEPRADSSRGRGSAYTTSIRGT
jgi:hypothetical protein